MQLELSEDQSLFHETTVRFIESELSLTQTRTLHDDPLGYDRGWLQKAAALGWFAMLVPQADGGGSISGAGLSDAAIVAEEIGRNVQPGPFVPMNVVAWAIAAQGTDTQRAAWLPRLIAAEAIATWAFADADGEWDGGSGMRLDGDTLTGTRGFVQEAVSADVLLVNATRDGAAVHVLVPADAPGVTIEPLTSLDLSRRFAHVHVHDVAVDPALVLNRADGDALLQTAIALNLADTVGAVDHLLSMTVAYAKDRVAFGRPIGSFQALKHVLADQLLHVETCKAGAEAAVHAIATGSDSAPEVVSMAAAYIGDVANEIAQACLQVHGGIGYTWEHDLHLLLRRVRSNAALYGTPTWHRERVCALHLGEGQS